MFVKRAELGSAARLVDGPEIVFINGMRQVGKTSMIGLLFNQFGDSHSFYLDLDDLNLLDVCNRGAEALIGHLKLQGADFSRRVLVAIDGIQYLKNPSQILKVLHDKHPQVKLIVSCSSSIEIGSKFKDKLPGRTAMLELGTLSFADFLLFRDKRAAAVKQNTGSLAEILDGAPNEAAWLAKSKLAGHLADYLVWGGFPGVTLREDAAAKEALLRDIHSSYIRKDVKEISAIEDIAGYNRLLQILAVQCGKLVNVNELCTKVGLSINTVKKYLFLLEQTYVMTLLRPYQSNNRKELTKMPKVYFNDIGLRNTATGSLRQPPVADGVQLENFVFSELKKRFVPNETLFFWKTAGGAKVDFVLLHEGVPLPVEVRGVDMKKPAISRSLRSFMDAFSPKRAIVVNGSLCCTVRSGATDVHFVPLFAL